MDFVIGHPRSGTMLISNLINACGLEVAAHELLPALTWSAVHEPTEYYRGHLDDRAIHNLLDIYAVRHRVETRIDCCWKLTFVLPVLLAHFPEAKIVHLARDPRQNVRSCYSLAYCGELWKHPGYQTDPQRNHWLRWMPEIHHVRWHELSELEKNCAFWDATHRFAFDALAQWPRVFRVRFEDLTHESRLAELHDFLELPRAPNERRLAVLNSRVNDMPDAKLETARLRGFEVGDYATWSSRDQVALQSICGETAGRLGYELSS